MKKTRRSGVRIMGRLIKLLKPLAGHMTLAILFGVLGHLCAISVTVLGAAALYNAATGSADTESYRTNFSRA